MDAATSLTAYAPEAGRYDELADERGRARPPWVDLVRTFARLGPDHVEQRRLQADRLLVAEGASHVVHDDGTDSGVPWRLDPVPVVLAATEWADLERGLVQRARLLDAVLDDLYGERRLLLEGVIPAELVFANRGYWVGCHGIVPAAGRRLVVYGADVARDAAGRFVVVHDHTDAPAGAGYAVLNRIVLARLFPDTYRDLGVRRLADYFASLRAGLAALAPGDRPNPRVVVLTPGVGHESYFEHSYLASYLGYNLVEGADVAVRDGRAWLRALGGLEPIDVLLRRVGDAAADVLEMDPDTPGGVPGLTEAAREQNVGMANALGSGLAGTLALQPYLPALCQRLLGEPLLLPCLPTRWCGDPDQRATVFQDLDRMVLYDTDPLAPAPAVFADALTDGELAAWRERIEAAPARYVAQEKAVFASAPVLRGQVVVPGTVVLRTQVAATPDGYMALPGGLGRVIEPDVPMVRQAAGISKDVWVLAAPGERRPGRRPEAAVPQIDLRASLPSRAAEALFWMGRNAERAETTARLALAIVSRRDEEPELAGLPERAWVGPLVKGLRAVSGGRNADDLDLPAHAYVHAEVAAALAGRRGSLADDLRLLRRSAGSVREFLSSTTWQVLSGLDGHRALLEDGLAERDLFAATESVERVVLGLMALAGLTNESVVRGPGWRFLDIGRRLERGVLLLSLLEATVAPAPEPSVIQPLYETVLAAAESLVVYRRRYRSDLTLDAVLDLLLADDTNPRSLAFQADRLAEDLAALPVHSDREKHAALVDDVARAVLSIDLSLATDNDGRYVAVDRLVLDTRGPLLELAAAVIDRWFSATFDARRYRKGAG